MLIEAKLRYARISPRKFRMVADLVRGLSVKEAESVLKFTVKRPARPMLKLLNSVTANAKNNFNIEKENLYIAEVKVDGGPMMKRFMPQARGVVHQIQKKTSHVYIRLEKIREEEEKKKKTVKKEEIKKVYQSEKPKEEVSLKKKGKDDEVTKEDSLKKQQPDKKSMFRRKSI
ncbi:MAG: 50S ribosomal protein L22 [Candidatus Pacebacteria bacterium]|nr:50S ribosomal protein L22 [Candidatus Paceibacterota bacterium]